LATTVKKKEEMKQTEQTRKDMANEQPKATKYIKE
jgi:hypothetical protein